MFSARVAIDNQYACNSIMDADKQFKRSCEMCCRSPYNNINCDHCQVAMVHDNVVEMLNDMIKVGGDK